MYHKKSKNKKRVNRWEKHFDYKIKKFYFYNPATDVYIINIIATS